MNLAEKFAELAKENDDAREPALKRLQTELYAMANCTDLNEVDVEERERIYELDPEREGMLLERDGELVRVVPNNKSGWVMLTEPDYEMFPLYYNGEFRVQFGTSSRGPIACFGDFADGRNLRALIAGDGTVREEWH